MFEAFSGVFRPPVTGYYQLAAIVHLTVSTSGEEAEEVQATISLCVQGHCHDASTA